VSRSPRFPRARAALARRVDPWAVRRTGELVRRKAASGSVDRELNALADLVLTRSARRVSREGAATEWERASSLGLTWLDAAATERPDDARVYRSVATAFTKLWQPRTQPVDEPPAEVRDAIRDQLHRLYYHVSRQTWKDTWYRGIATYKCPTDMWVYQELLDTVRPGLVVETGTFRGGSALFLADRLETLGHGEVVSIDIDVQPDRPEHPRLTYLEGSSVAPDILDQVRRRLPSDGSGVLVILDSDHSRDHVLAELEAYASMVSPGSYLVVEDTNVNGHPAAPDHGPGPYEAVQAFLATDPGYEVDARCERYYLTQNPSGYLRRAR
jgi:cephalosporin hydroxylase